jgi:hypothetical protein
MTVSLVESGVIRQTDTNPDLSGFAGIAGVTAGVTSGGVRLYIVDSTISRIELDGTLSIDPDIECLVCSEATQIRQAGTLNFGKQTIVNGKVRNSRGTGLVLNRPQTTFNTTATNYQVLNGATFNTFGGQIKNRGTIFFGSTTTAAGQNININIAGKTDFMLTGTATQGLRIFAEPANINIDCILSGINAEAALFSNLGFNTLSADLDFGTYACDGNGPKETVRVSNAVFANNKGASDYQSLVRLIGTILLNINKYIFTNPDVGSELRTVGITRGVGVAEIEKDLRVRVANLAGNAVPNAVVYTKFLGATTNPPDGSRFAGIDDYVTPRHHIVSSGEDGLTPTSRVLYAVAQRYETGLVGPVPLFMESLTTSANDVQSAVVWSYGHLVVQPLLSLRGIGVLTQDTTVFEDVGVTLSETAAGDLTSINTLDNLYDRAKWHKTRAIQANLEYPTISAQPVTANGAELDLGSRNLVVDATAAAAFAVNTSTHTITIKSSVLSAGTKFKSLKTTGTVSFANGATLTAALEDANNAGQISIVGVLNAETVEFRKASDNSVIASRTGPGSFAIAPANVGVSAYFVRLSGSNTVMSTITAPVTLTTGVNPDVPLYAGAEVQIAQAARIEQLPTLAQIEASTLASDTASAVWNEVLTGATHNVTASAGRRLRTLSDTVILIDGVGNTMSNVAGVGYITLPDATTVCIKQAIRVGDMVRYVREFDSTTKVATLDSPWCTVTAGDVDYTIFNGRESSLSTGPTLAEIEASTVLAKETSVQAVKSTTGLIPYLLVK